MTCTPYKVPGGGFGIACTRGRPRCSKCGNDATLLCDAPREGALGGTCSAPICTKCRRIFLVEGKKLDFCPPCAEKRAAARAVQS